MFWRVSSFLCWSRARFRPNNCRSSHFPELFRTWSSLNLSILRIPGCIAVSSNVPRAVKIGFIPEMVTATVMFLLSTFQCIRYIFGSQWRSMPFMVLFLRDGVLWFTCIFAILVVQQVLLMVNPFWGDALLLPIVVTNGIASFRILINMRTLGSNPENSLQFNSITTIKFQSGGAGDDSTVFNTSMYRSTRQARGTDA